MAMVSHGLQSYFALCCVDVFMLPNICQSDLMNLTNRQSTKTTDTWTT